MLTKTLPSTSSAWVRVVAVWGFAVSLFCVLTIAMFGQPNPSGVGPDDRIIISVLAMGLVVGGIAVWLGWDFARSRRPMRSVAAWLCTTAASLCVGLIYGWLFVKGSWDYSGDITGQAWVSAGSKLSSAFGTIVWWLGLCLIVTLVSALATVVVVRLRARRRPPIAHASG